MERRYVQCDRDKCTGCMICEFICSAAKEGSFHLERSRIHVIQTAPSSVAATACQFCRNHPCIKACPRDALSADEATHTLRLDKARCAGCGWCIEACPFGAITLDDSTKSVIACDLCHNQGRPRCIEVCPQNALSLYISKRPQ
jgi:anaerobic carbon-monoxide dehydrogenase iron sulfur subunit